jgi:hypothetical protein
MKSVLKIKIAHGITIQMIIRVVSQIALQIIMWMVMVRV